MRYDPTLVISRLVVERGDKIAYDQFFHLGVNVIRGENSSGKSTVLNFIFYGLGGDLADWSDTALLCSRVFLEVQLNGKPATLCREISSTASQPMDIFGGDYNKARKATASEWLRYPYRRSATRESFSQALFRLLDIPEVSSDQTGNVTMHQVLRLLYADQLSPVETLLRFERFDPPALRDAVARLLCGAFDSELYNNEQRIKLLNNEFDAVEAELKSLFAVLGKTSQPLTREWIAAQRSVLDEKQKLLRVQIEATERKIFSEGTTDRYTLDAQDTAYNEVQRLQTDLAKKRAERDGVVLAMADSTAFIRALNLKLEAMNDSSAVATHLGEIRFKFCPSCYAALDEASSDHACHLCKTPFDPDRIRGRVVALINETSIQLKQSQSLQDGRERQISELDRELKTIEIQWHEAAERLAQLQQVPSTGLRSALQKLHEDTGYLQREREDLEQRAQLIELISELSQKKNALNDELQILKTRNDQLRTAQEKRLAEAYTFIADETRKLLHHDLPREPAFQVANSIQFDFASNKITVDGQSYFSASSRVILKSSFFLAFLSAATKLNFFRHPRFCMLDTIEDKGMEPTRSQNFQLQIRRISEEANVEHQIIFATSMIAPELNNDVFAIGAFSTHDARTLNIG